ncbi:unnamed protein product [Effrenium voratum]|uniref:Uncharacterized protein n=1 Tax=Effrenium voratum TaxID=2562239 RepID=A0AA36NA22_9DINO|nr:unnamed protein product [Effrenium voratum]CAJ1416984.1 unnamed protein product [Effrenium voratum]
MSRIIACAALAFSFASVAEAGALRGRQLQRDSMETMTPQCKPGYVDITGGQAYHWSCGFYCEGGQYFSTANCICACQTPEVAEKLQDAVPAPLETQAPMPLQPGGIIVTAPPSPTAAPSVPVHEIPVGELGDTNWNPPPTLGLDYMGGVQTPAPQPAATNTQESMDWTVVLSAIGAALVVIVCGVVLCINWPGDCLKRKRTTTPFKFAETPAVTMHVPSHACPQPFEVPSRRSSQESASRALKPGISKQSANSWCSSASGRHLKPSRQSNASNASVHLSLPASKNSSTSASSRGSICSTSGVEGEPQWAFKCPQDHLPAKFQTRAGGSGRKIAKVHPARFVVQDA